MNEILLANSDKIPTVEILTPSAVPSVRGHAHGVAINDKMYIMGGWSGSAQLKDIHVYDPATNAFSFLRNAPDSRHSFGMCAKKDDSGFHAIYSATPPYGNSIYTYNISDNSDSTSSLSSSGIVPRQELALQKIGNYGYIFGGWDQYNNHLNDTLRWTLGTTTIQNMNPSNPPGPRAAAVTAVIGNYLYLMGGIATRSPLTYLKDLWRYDVTANTWTRLKDFPRGISAASMVAKDGMLYVFGGFMVNVGYVAVIHRYDPTSDVWTELTQFPASLAVRALCACVLNNDIYYFSGVDGSGVFKNTLLRVKV